VSLATKLLTADVPVAAMALTTWGPPGEIRGGFSFEPSAPHVTQRDSNAILLTFVSMLKGKKGRQCDLGDPSSTCRSSTFSGRLLDLRTGGLSPGRIQLGNHC
jgi:hypothetical protein